MKKTDNVFNGKDPKFILFIINLLNAFIIVS